MHWTLLLTGTIVIIGALVAYSCGKKVHPDQIPAYNDTINQQFWSADWSTDDRLIAVAGVDSTLRLFNADNLKLHKSYHIGNWTHVVAWNPDGKSIAIATLSNYVLLLHVETGVMTTLDNTLGPGNISDGNGSRAMGWNRDGSMLAVGGLNGVIKIWGREGRLLQSIDKYPPGAPFVTYLALDWHPSEDIFVAGNFEIAMYDKNGRELVVMEHQNKEAIILCTAWHPDGEFFVIGDYGYTWEGASVPSLLHFWSRDGQILQSVPGSEGEYRNIAWNTDGTRLATASDVLRIWTRDGKLLYKGPPDSTNYLWGISWNHQGTRIVTSSRHKTVALWDSTAQLVRRLEVMD